MTIRKSQPVSSNLERRLLPYFRGFFDISVVGERWRFAAQHTELHGVCVTVYRQRVPVFNLVVDKGCKAALPMTFRYEWFGGRVRWT